MFFTWPDTLYYCKYFILYLFVDSLLIVTSGFGGLLFFALFWFVVFFTLHQIECCHEGNEMKTDYIVSRLYLSKYSGQSNEFRY